MSVYKAINAVQSDLCKVGVSKDSTNSFDNYKFRGIDAIYNALSPLMAKHGLCILPRMISRTCEERVSQKGGALFYVTVDAEFDFVSVEDGSKHVVKTFGEAMDRGDKATNKAMSAAYKYAAFQAFAIPTEGDNDADNSIHEVKVKSPGVHKPTAGFFEALDADTQDTLTNAIASCMEYFNAGQIEDAIFELESACADNDQKTAVWDKLPSNVRSAIKKHKAANQPTKE